MRKNFTALLCRYMFITALVLSYSGAAISQSNSKDEATPIIDLKDITPGWWRPYLTFSEEQKNTWSSGLRKELLKASKMLLKEDRQQFISVSNTLLDSLSKPEHYSYNKFPSFILDNKIQLSDLYAIFSEKSRLEYLIASFEKNAMLVDSKINDLRARIKDLTVKYRRLDELSVERIQAGAYLVAIQMQLLNTNTKKQKLTKKIEQLDDLNTRANTSLADAIKKIEITEKDYKKISKNLYYWEKQIDNNSSLAIPSNDDIEIWRIESRAYYLTRLAHYEKWLTIKTYAKHLLEKDEVDINTDEMYLKLQDIEGVKHEAFLLKRQFVNTLLESPKKLSFYMSKVEEVEKKLSTAQLIFSANIDFSNFLNRYFARKSGYFSFIGYFIKSTLNIQNFELNNWLDTVIFLINDNPITLRDIGYLFILILATFIAMRWSKYVLRKAVSRKAISRSASYTVSRISQYFFISLLIIFSLSILGLDMSKLAIIAGALSVGIGFGLQSIFNNFVSGLILLLERPLKVGDVVELDSGLKGIIKEIKVRSTQLLTRDNVDVLVPNSEFISAKVINYTYKDPIRRLRIPFSVAYRSDKNVVKKAALSCDNNLKYSINAGPYDTEVWLVNFGEYSLDFELIVWIDTSKVSDVEQVIAAYLWELDTQLIAADIDIPFPQRDLHLKSINESVSLSTTKSSG